MTNKMFDLEQGILQCWGVVDDLKLLYGRCMERPLSQDDMANILLGMQQLYQLKFEDCFNNFEDFTKEFYQMRSELRTVKPKEFVE